MSRVIHGTRCWEIKNFIAQWKGGNRRQASLYLNSWTLFFKFFGIFLENFSEKKFYKNSSKKKVSKNFGKK